MINMKNFLSKKKYKKNIGTYFCMTIVFVVGLLFLLDATQSNDTLKNWNNNGVVKYQGDYTFFEQKYYRNTVYEFVLGNGDTIIVPCEYILYSNVNFESFEFLSFKYSSNKNIIKNGTHTCISMSTIDEDIVFVQEEFMRKDIRSMSIICYVIGIICIVLVIIPQLFNLLIIILSRPRRKKSGDGSKKSRDGSVIND